MGEATQNWHGSCSRLVIYTSKGERWQSTEFMTNFNDSAKACICLMQERLMAYLSRIPTLATLTRSYRKV